jgi:hypothetical protein
MALQELVYMRGKFREAWGTWGLKRERAGGRRTLFKICLALKDAGRDADDEDRASKKS